MPSAAWALYCINCSPTPLPPRTPPPRPLSHAAHMAGQPMSCKRGLKAPAGPPTMGLLEARRGKSSLPFLLANPSPLPLPSFAVGRHYGGHYSRPSKLPRELCDSDAGLSRGPPRSHKPRGTPSSPAEPEMWRIYQMRGLGLVAGKVSCFAFPPGTLSDPARTKPHAAGMRQHRGLERKPQQQVLLFSPLDVSCFQRSFILKPFY